MSELAKRKKYYLGPSELSPASKPARMSTPSSPNSTIMSDNSIDFLVIERPDKPFKCSECNWSFKYNRNLLHHKHVKHGMDNRALYHQAKAEAQTKWIPYNSNLEKNKNVHPTCSYCSRVFISETKRDAHEKIHRYAQKDFQQKNVKRCMNARVLHCNQHL